MIGKGKYGATCLALHNTTKNIVVIKQLKKDLLISNNKV